MIDLALFEFFTTERTESRYYRERKFSHLMVAFVFLSLREKFEENL